MPQGVAFMELWDCDPCADDCWLAALKYLAWSLFTEDVGHALCRLSDSEGMGAYSTGLAVAATKHPRRKKQQSTSQPDSKFFLGINTEVKDHAPAAKKQATTTKERMAGFVGWLVAGRKVVKGRCDWWGVLVRLEA